MSLRPALSLFLSLALVVASLAFGAARGQLPVAGQVELCLGGAAVSVALDETGRPVRHLHLCPDGALLAMAGLPGLAPVPVPPETRSRSLAQAPRPADPLVSRPFPLGARAPPPAIV